MAETLLLVDPEPTVLHSLYRILKRDGHDVLTAPSGEQALEILQAESIAVCLTALRLPGMDGLELIRRARAGRSATEFLLLTETPTVEIAVLAMRTGACDVVAKPFLRQDLESAALAALERSRGHRPAPPALVAPPIAEPLLGDSRAIRDVLELVARVGPSTSTVLLRGESGTGKEIVASALQRHSARHDAPFIKVHCAAIPDTLLESELFGYEKGAFTGAGRSKKGRFELADGGTIFLDEIGEMSLEAQTKLLRVLQEGEFDRIGATRTQKVDTRVIAATNADLERAVAERRFREDLYYRLRVIEIRVPPLRARREDIPMLAEHFVHRFAARNGKAIHGLSPQALDCLVQHDWPGNVRELENCIERAVVLARGTQVTSDDLGREFQPRQAPVAISFAVGTRLDEIERRMIAETLRHTHGDKTRAASLLGITARTIYRKLERRRRELHVESEPSGATRSAETHFSPEPDAATPIAASIDPGTDAT